MKTSEFSKGIDLSTWNGDVDFKKVAEDGISFVILRSGFRKVTDSKFLENVEGFRKVGIPIKAVYHYSYAVNGAEVISEAKHCLEILESANFEKGSVMVFFETDNDAVLKALDRGINLSQSVIITNAMTFCSYISAKGYPCGVKCNLDYYNNIYLSDMKQANPFWIVDYSGEEHGDIFLHQYTNKGFVSGIRGQVNLDYMRTSLPQVEEDELASAEDVVCLAMSLVGKNEQDGSYKEIIDMYNSYNGEFPRGTKMLYEWAWCACFWSALAVKLNLTSIMPIEISCGYLIEEAKKMGIWIEDDHYIPDPGDAILYDWDAKPDSDCLGWPDHVGLVAYVDEQKKRILCIEGNKNDQVGYRVIPFNYAYTRGFITPQYQHDFEFADDLKQELFDILQNYDTGDDALPKSSAYADSFSKNVAGSYRVTATDLNLRSYAGTTGQILTVIPNGAVVRCYGYFTDLIPDYTKERWLYVQYDNGADIFTGFVCGKYVKKL